MRLIVFASMCSLRSVAFVVFGVACATSASARQGAPERGAQIAQMRCTVCHAMDLIEQQRLTRAAWDREVAKMIGWGAAVDASQADDLAAYLTVQFGPRGGGPTPRQADNTTVATLIGTRCTVCHGMDLIQAQQLDDDGWRRELTKMIGWGAVLSTDERNLLIVHLAR